jgi:CRP/FNR family cyclic AMP-dependent transcriptional regulator
MAPSTYEQLNESAGYSVADEDVFADLDAEQRAQVDQLVKTQTYSAGHLFYAPEDQIDQLLILRRGRVRIYKLSPEGRALTLLVLQPQSLFGELMLLADLNQDSFAEAMTECEVTALGRNEVRTILMRYPAVALRLMEIMSQRLRAFEHRLADIAFKSVPQRLAAVLLNLAALEPERNTKADEAAVVRYTHQQLAELISSYRETVTKAIGEFREAGLIRVEEETIYLTSIDKLQELAGR